MCDTSYKLKKEHLVFRDDLEIDEEEGTVLARFSIKHPLLSRLRIPVDMDVTCDRNGMSAEEMMDFDCFAVHLMPEERDAVRQLIDEELAKEGKGTLDEVLAEMN